MAGGGQRLTTVAEFSHSHRQSNVPKPKKAYLVLFILNGKQNVAQNSSQFTCEVQFVLVRILTYYQKVLPGVDRLEGLLRGDLTGVVARHVRVDIRQHNTTAVTSRLLEEQLLFRQ